MLGGWFDRRHETFLDKVKYNYYYPLYHKVNHCIFVVLKHVKGKLKLSVPTLYKHTNDDLDNIFLHANFGCLERFVEDELPRAAGWQGVEYDEKDENIGVSFLLWHTRHSLKEKYTSKDEEDFVKDCAKKDKEILDLYRWWKVRKHSNPSDMDFGFPDSTEINKLRVKVKKDGMVHYTYTDPESPIVKKFYDEVRASSDRENAFYEKDTEMLVRLMKLRRYLWT